MLHRTLIAAALLALAACQSVPPAPTDAQMARADFGRPPADHVAIVKAWYGAALKDPGSAQYRTITEPVQYWLGARGTQAGVYGYLVCATVNAKNSYGAYVGFKTEALLIRDGAVVRVIKDGAGPGAPAGC